MGYRCNKCETDISYGEHAFTMDNFGRALCVECRDDIACGDGSQTKPGTYCPNPTKYELKLYRKLKESGIDCRLQHRDERKQVVIIVPHGKLLIEIDSKDRPFKEGQFDTELLRDDHYERDGYKTLRFENDQIQNGLEFATGEILDEINRRERKHQG